MCRFSPSKLGRGRIHQHKTESQGPLVPQVFCAKKTCPLVTVLVCVYHGRHFCWLPILILCLWGSCGKIKNHYVKKIKLGSRVITFFFKSLGLLMWVDIGLK